MGIRKRGADRAERAKMRSRRRPGSASFRATTLLAGDRRWIFKRRSSSNCWCVAGGWDKMVSGVWRYAPITSVSVGSAADGKVLVAARARTDRSLARPTSRSPRDRTASRAVRLNDLARAASQCRNAGRRLRLSSDHGSVACRSRGPTSQAGQAGAKQRSAHLCAGQVGRQGRNAGREADRGTRGSLEWSTPWSQAVDDGRAPGALSRSPTVSRSTSLKIFRCASATKRSIRRCISKDAEPCGANSAPACARDEPCAFRESEYAVVVSPS
jgi:hypothetical protein